MKKNTEQDDTSRIQNFIKKDTEKNPELKKKYEQASLNLDAAVLVKDMHKDLGMTQVGFTKYVGKPQSIIGRIEAENINASIRLLDKTTNRVHRQAKLVLI